MEVTSTYFFSASDGSSLLGLGALTTSSVTLYDGSNNVVQTASLNSSALSLNLFSNVAGYRIYQITMPVEAEFVKARVQMSGIFLFNGFRVYEIYYSYSPLPIDLTYFRASSEANFLEAYWETASEINNDYFELYAGSSKTELNSIKIIKGSGTTNIPKKYYVKAYLPDINIQHFICRLVQVDFNGEKFTYPDFIVKKQNNKLMFELLKNNQVRKLRLRNINSGSKYNINIISIEGKIVFEEIVVVKDYYEKILPDLSPGLFIIKITEEAGQQNHLYKVIM